ncbi:hypothetical protein [Streptomyces sp. NPDC001744]|uniref:hypothetical protein n=1 Tax=Streptomyces sp. NPDC001744 TaxID=3364606 RepID=UPI003689DFA1
MSELNVNSGGLDKGGEAVKNVGEELKVARDEYMDKITSYRGCWGTGEFGEAFAKKYYQGLGFVVEGSEALVEALKASGQSLTDTSDRFKRTQDGITGNIDTHTKKR